MHLIEQIESLTSALGNMWLESILIRGKMQNGKDHGRDINLLIESKHKDKLFSMHKSTINQNYKDMWNKENTINLLYPILKTRNL